MNCPPSVVIEQKIPPRVSTYAEEGTFAHELAELSIRSAILHEISEEDFEVKQIKLMANKYYSQAMAGYVMEFVNYCAEQYAEAKTKGTAFLQSETKVSLEDYIPEGFGTADCIIIGGDTLEVVDLKYGKGVAVYADHNPQLMLYALGALKEFDLIFDIKQVRCTIVQPRLGNISTWTIAADELKAWAKNEVKPKAQMALKGEGELASGDWCKFCRAKTRCRKMYEEFLEIAKHEFTDPHELTDLEVEDILLKKSKIVHWLDELTDITMGDMLAERRYFKRIKLVSPEPRREWIDDTELIASRILETCPSLSDEDLFQLSLKPITRIEKLVGKKKLMEIPGIIFKKKVNPAIVPIDDPREDILKRKPGDDFIDPIDLGYTLEDPGTSEIDDYRRARDVEKRTFRNYEE